MAIVERQQGLNQSHSIDPALQHVFGVSNRDLMFGVCPNKPFCIQYDRQGIMQTIIYAKAPCLSTSTLNKDTRNAPQTQTENDISMKAKDLNYKAF